MEINYLHTKVQPKVYFEVYLPYNFNFHVFLKYIYIIITHATRDSTYKREGLQI